MSSSSGNHDTQQQQQQQQNKAVTTLDKTQFDRPVNIIGLRVPNASLSQFCKVMSKFMFRAAKKFKNVIEDDKHLDSKLVLLAHEVAQSEDVNTFRSDAKQVLETQFNSFKAETFTCTFGYDQLTQDEIMRTILPANMEIPSGYEQIGHIAHLNLRDEHEPYKYLIGQVILEKSPSIETVVNKVGSISTQFREFKMEVLAGKNDFNVEVVCIISLYIFLLPFCYAKLSLFSLCFVFCFCWLFFIVWRV